VRYYIPCFPLQIFFSISARLASSVCCLVHYIHESVMHLYASEAAAKIANRVICRRGFRRVDSLQPAEAYSILNLYEVWEKERT